MEQNNSLLHASSILVKDLLKKLSKKQLNNVPVYISAKSAKPPHKPVLFPVTEVAIGTKDKSSLIIILEIDDKGALILHDNK